MTEHSKIPLPEGPKARSLFERAEDALGLEGFRPAPVPSRLAEPANRQVPKRQARGEPVSAPNSTPLAGPDTTHSVAPVEAPVSFPTHRHTIDREKLRQRGLLVPGGPATALLEEFRIVKRPVLVAARDTRAGGASPQRVLVTSPLPGEGKTFCAVNLALAIAAEKDREVLLVDADVAKPSLLSLFGLADGLGNERGLVDALADPDVAVEDCVIATDVPGLYLLPAGNHRALDSEYLASGRTREVLDRLTRGAPNRIVIFDSPPALAASPAAELARHVGQTVVVCRADQTGQSALEDALSLLSACPDVKLLLNAAHFSPSGRRFGSYYGDEG